MNQGFSRLCPYKGRSYRQYAMPWTRLLTRKYFKKKCFVSRIGGEGGSRAGAGVRALASHQCGLGSIPRTGVICGMSLLVVYSAPRGFSPGTPVFPSPQKPTFELIYVNLIDLICVASHKLFTAHRWFSWLSTGLPCGRS